jgi:hypothetical protein
MARGHAGRRKRTPILYTAAQIRGIGGWDDDSDWVTAKPTLQPPQEPVPKPGTLLLVASGLLGLGGLRWRRGREYLTAG